METLRLGPASGSISQLSLFRIHLAWIPRINSSWWSSMVRPRSYVLRTSGRLRSCLSKPPPWLCAASAL